VEAGHLVAAISEANQVGPGPARDVEDPAHAAPGEVAEAVDEKIDLPLADHVERDLVAPPGRVLFHRMYPHQVSMASRRTHDAAMAVRPDGSQACATSPRSPPPPRHGPRKRTITPSPATRSPPGSGEPVPGDSDGSNPSPSIVT